MKGKIRQIRIRWLRHLVRKEESYARKTMGAMVVGRRRRGRPKNLCRDLFKDSYGGNREEEASEGKMWRKMILDGKPHITRSKARRRSRREDLEEVVEEEEKELACNVKGP